MGLKNNSGSHSSTEAEVIPSTDCRMRTPFRHSLLVFKSAVVGTAHSGIGVFVMTETERKRHDARSSRVQAQVAAGRGQSQDTRRGRRKLRIVDQSTSLEGAGGECPAFLIAASESDVGPHHTRVSHGMLTRCVSEVAVLCLLSKLIRFLSGMHA